MKRFLLPLVIAGLLVNAQFAVAQAKKSPSSTVKKKVVRKTVMRKSPPVDPTEGDVVDGDDLTVRRAAVAALGTTRGSVVVADPNTGRILTMVNQKLGFQAGFTPCSTIKLVTSLAALNEHVVERDTVIHLSRYATFNLTTAIAHSNNPYFATLGNRLGFERVTHYAQMLGLGEKAGLDIPGEQPGSIAAAPPKARRGGHDDQLRRRFPGDAAGTDRPAFVHCQRRHVVLSAVSAQPRRNRSLHSQGEASVGVGCRNSCRYQSRHAGRRGFRHRAARRL